MKEELDSQLLYNITKEDDLTYSFITVGGIKYIAYFICCQIYDEDLSNTFMFNFDPLGCEGCFDSKIRPTIIHIIDTFFESKRDSIIYVCDSLDGREKQRDRLFNIWFKDYCKTRKHIHRESVVEKGEGYDLFASLFIHKSNPNLAKILTAFKNLVGMLGDGI